MPRYDYHCTICRKEFEQEVSLQAKMEGAVPECPHCGTDEVKQVFQAAAISRTRQNNGSCCGGGCGC